MRVQECPGGELHHDLGVVTEESRDDRSLTSQMLWVREVGCAPTKGL